ADRAAGRQRLLVVRLLATRPADNGDAGFLPGAPDGLVLRQPGLAFPLLGLVAGAADTARHRREERHAAGTAPGAAVGASAGSPGFAKRSPPLPPPLPPPAGIGGNGTNGGRVPSDPPGAPGGVWPPPPPPSAGGRLRSLPPPPSGGGGRLSSLPPPPLGGGRL